MTFYLLSSTHQEDAFWAPKFGGQLQQATHGKMQTCLLGKQRNQGLWYQKELDSDSE